MNLSNPLKIGKKVFNIKAEKLYREACELFYLKNYEQSLILLEEVIQLDKMHTKALLLKGDIKLLMEGNEYEALDAYEKAIFSNPFSTQALGSKAYVLDILGRFEEAYENCELAFKYANQNDNDQLSSLYDQKISLLCSLKRFEEANKILAEAIEVLSEESGNYLKSCYAQKINTKKKNSQTENQPNLKLIF